MAPCHNHRSMEIVVPAGYRHLFEVSPQRPIVKIPAPVLREKAKPVAKVTPRHRILAENMVRIMRDSHGIGLAGPQIGIQERIIVISPDHRPQVIINPEILESSGTQIGEEGCLSIPGLYGDVERAENVVVKGLNRKGDTVTYTLDGLAARVIQHEIDHLDGILFSDKADPATLHWRMPDHEDELE
jgi:peptide deformylase